MRQHEDVLDTLGIGVVVVTFELGFLAQAYVRETQLAWPMLIDESREVYTAYGMNRGGWWDIWRPASWWAYAKLLARGHRMRPSKGDVNQMGGDVLIDPNGVVRLLHVGSGPADRPSVASLLETVRSAAAAPEEGRP